MRRSPRSAKIARCARCSDCDFADHSDLRIKSPISSMSAIKFADICQVCPFSRFSAGSSLRIASKVNQSGWAILSHDFSKRPSMEPGNEVEAPHGRYRRKKSPGVSASSGRKALAIFAGDQIRRDGRIKSPGVSPA